jgi:competence protein ComGC
MNNPGHHSRVSERGNAAFGLIALLIVMAIVLYLMFGNMGGTTYADEVKKGRDQGRQMNIDMQAQQLLTDVTQYQLANGELPQSMEDLDAPPGAYVDPWGLQMRFTCEKDPRSGRGVLHIVSAGLDGEFDTEDDLTTTKNLAI